MTPYKLSAFLNRIGENFTKNWYEIRDLQEWMLEEVYRKYSLFPKWKKKVIFSWSSFKKRKKLGNHIAFFYYKKMDALFRFFFSKIFPFHNSHLDLRAIYGDPLKDGELYFEYRYFFSPEEVQVFDNFKKKFNHPDHLDYIISYIFNLIIMVFGKLMKNLLKDERQILMISADVQTFSLDKLQEKIKNNPSTSSVDPKIVSQELLPLSSSRSNLNPDQEKILNYLKEEDVEKCFSMIHNLFSSSKEEGDSQKEPPVDCKYITFLIITRKSNYEFLRKYLQMMIFQFAETLPNIDPHLLSILRKKKNTIYELALAEYPHTMKHLDIVLFTLEKKAHNQKQCTPFLDILNFICSRIEDSLYNTNELVREIIYEKITKDDEVLEALLSIFNFLNNSASLFSTFQSNNRANIQKQYLLFFAYGLYFCSEGISLDLEQNSFFFKDELKRAINQINGFHVYSSLNPNVFPAFFMMGQSFPSNEGLNIVFERIFGKSVFELNENFFEVFLNSLNKKFIEILADYYFTIENFNYRFDDIIHILSIILHNLVLKVFIRDTPEEAKLNFRDRLSRYTPEKIALRLLELRIFQDIPLSDNNWQDYYLSRNKEYVKKFFRNYFVIPDYYFFSPERLLKINKIYERSLPPDTPLLETWMVFNIMKKFLDFQLIIENRLEKEGKEKNFLNLASVLTEELSKGIIDPIRREQIEEIAILMSKLWFF